MKQGAVFAIGREASIEVRAERTSALDHALRIIVRDHEMVFGQQLRIFDDLVVRGERVELSGTKGEAVADIVVRYAEGVADCPGWPEAYSFRFAERPDRTVLHIVGRDELGLVYGLLAYSHRVLGIDPMWYWADLPPKKRERITIPAQDVHSSKPRCRYRGWFVNDEVCLIGWSEQYPPARDVWLPVFECLLRLGGNMVIPGTDLPKSGVHADLAREMGLWLTHHHAEPLGAEMFLRAYPGKRASYREHPELFEALWREAIEKQKDERTVWVLSFRGQGDKPFWEDDPACDTPESRGATISHVVRRQYDMIRESVPDPVCSMALYGEIAELYKSGHIRIPEDVILIWADNGYGKMVSRRHGNQNHRIPALPENGDSHRHGVYYHVTFHDLQASNHLAMFSASPDLIASELSAAFRAGASEYLLVNSGNIRPHLHALDLAARMWNEGEVDPTEHLRSFVRRMYASRHEDIIALYRGYAEATIPYGPHEDDRAGDEYYHHPARQIIGHWIQGFHDWTKESLIWATGRVPFAEQVAVFKKQVSEAVPRWVSLEADCLRLSRSLSREDAARLSDHLLFHIRLHLSGCRGFQALCQSYESFRAGSHPIAFVHASRALWRYARGLRVLADAEYGKWTNFYSADWLTNIANTVEHVESLRRYIRIQGDSPDMFLWYKAYLMPETEKHIYLENTHRKPLTNDELAERLLKQFIEQGLIDEQVDQDEASALL